MKATNHDYFKFKIPTVGTTVWTYENALPNTRKRHYDTPEKGNQDGAATYRPVKLLLGMKSFVATSVPPNRNFEEANVCHSISPITSN